MPETTMKPTQLFYAADAQTLLGFNSAEPNDYGADTVWWPEISNNLPLHPKQIIRQAPLLEGKRVYTMSEHIVLYFIREVRLGHLTPAQVEVYWVHDVTRCRQLRLDSEGEFLDHWPEGFFDERGELLFM